MSSLVVNTNLSAISTLNDLNATNNSETTAINRLSSGLQIAGAATGPAQYVVSQSLESEANGYGTAIDNAQDGVSMIQTVSGALSQISSILQTMEQLALTSANGATETTTALAANQSEFADLVTSINEIAQTTTYGTTQLLVGTGAGSGSYTGKLQVGAFDTSDQQLTLSIHAVTAQALGLKGSAATLSSSATVATGKINVAATAGLTLEFKVGTSDTYTVNLAKGTHTLASIATAINKAAPGVLNASVATSKLVVKTDATGTTAKLKLVAAVAALHMTSTAQVHGTHGSAITISTATAAEAAVTTVRTALTTVDTVASGVGAKQNELNDIVANLTVGQQNLEAADSQLVDVNMAEEMTTFSTDQILMQSGVSMLAQAQQLPSLVLKLMGG